jgi:hypothetical protein
MSESDHNAAPLALLFSAFCRQIGISRQTGMRAASAHPEQLPPTFTIGDRKYVLRADAESWLRARSLRAR